MEKRTIKKRFLVLFIIALLYSCQKDDLSDGYSSNDNFVQAEKNFFPAKLYNSPTDTVVDILFQTNSDTNFVTQFIKDYGVPLWDYGEDFHENHSIIVYPIKNVLKDSIDAILICNLFSESLTMDVLKNNRIKNSDSLKITNEQVDFLILKYNVLYYPKRYPNANVENGSKLKYLAEGVKCVTACVIIGEYKKCIKHCYETFVSYERIWPDNLCPACSGYRTVVRQKDLGGTTFYARIPKKNNNQVKNPPKTNLQIAQEKFKAKYPLFNTAKVKLNENEIANLTKLLDDLASDKMYKEILDQIKSNGLDIGVAMSKEQVYSAWYDAKDKMIYFKPADNPKDNITNLNMPSFQEEIIHAYQGSYYKDKMPTKQGQAGTFNIEFEAKLIQDISPNYITPNDAYRRSDSYKRWVKEINSSNTKIDQKEYADKMKYFKNQMHPDYQKKVTDEKMAPDAYYNIRQIK